MKNLIYLLIILAVGCCPTKNCDNYKKQIETCKEEKSNLKFQVDELKLENIALMDSINKLSKKANSLQNAIEYCNEMYVEQSSILNKCENENKLLSKRASEYLIRISELIENNKILTE